jgi:hypothetical protein
MYLQPGPLRGWGGGQPGRRPLAHEFKQIESCFLNHNSSIHMCCTDSFLLMTHRGGLSLSIIIWRIGRGGEQTSWCPGAQIFSWQPCREHLSPDII